MEKTSKVFITFLNLVIMSTSLIGQSTAYKSTVLNLIKAENQGTEKVWKNFVAPQFEHSLNMKGIKPSIEGWMNIKSKIRTAFPTQTKENLLLIQEGNYVVERSKVTANHSGTYNGIPPSHKDFTWHETNVYEFVGDQIIRFHPNIRLEKLLTSLKDLNQKFYEPKPTSLNRMIGGGIKMMSWFSSKLKLKNLSQLEYNREIVRKYAIEFKNQQKFLVFPKLYRPPKFRHHFNFPNHKDQLFSFVSVGREFLSGFPDVQVELKALIAEGDYVVEFNDVVGTHEGEYAGITPTSRKVKWTETHIYRLENGKIVENFPAVNFERIIQQIK